MKITLGSCFEIFFAIVLFVAGLKLFFNKDRPHYSPAHGEYILLALSSILAIAAFLEGVPRAIVLSGFAVLAGFGLLVSTDALDWLSWHTPEILLAVGLLTIVLGKLIEHRTISSITIVAGGVLLVPMLVEWRRSLANLTMFGRRTL